jgi:hypothetical protein
MQTLFPFLGLFATIALFIYFLIWKRQNKDSTKPAKKPIKRSKPTAPPVYREQQEQGTNYSHPDNKEGFADYVEPISSNWHPTYPQWSKASIIFSRGMNDNIYKKYEVENLQPSADLVALVGSLPVPTPEVPNYGAQLETFDSGDLTSIPWDADNTSYLQKDIVWGTVSRQASASIFIKVYHKNLMSDSENLIETESGFQYHSPILDINAYDPTTAAVMQAGDQAMGMVGQMGFDSIKSKVTTQFKKGVIANLQARAAQGSLGTADQSLLHNMVAEQRTADREAKIAAGIALSDAEKAEQALVDAERGGKDAGKLKWFAKIGKQLEAVKQATKAKLGIRFAEKFAAKMKAKMAAMLQKVLTKALQKMGLLSAITALINGMAVAVTTGAVVTFGALAPLAVVVDTICFVWDILDAICMIVVLALQIILPALMDKAMANGGVCPGSGKPLDQLISDDFLYFIFTTFIPIGGVLDAFGPYLCYNDDGSSNFKQPLYIPPYFADSTLSLYRHIYPLDMSPRGDSTSYTDPAHSVPAGWTITAGIARSPCDPGTWTSSDVDMLCNISTYVPQTYTKASSVPSTIIKGSRVPKTYAKSTYITTYSKQVNGRGAGRIADYQPCNESDGPTAHAVGLDCWKVTGQVCADNCAAGWDDCKYSWTDGGCCNNWSC